MKYEYEMKQGIIKFLQKEYHCSQIGVEIDSGYGIADYIGIFNYSEIPPVQFNHIADIFFLQKMKLNEPVELPEIEKYSFYSRKYLRNVVIKRYVEQGILLKSGKNVYTRIRDLNPNGVRIISIEAKIAKWRNAARQAFFYKKFSDLSFVALYEKFTKNVDLNLFSEMNIGLISIDDEMKSTVLHNPTRNSDFYAEAKLFVSGKISICN